MGQVNIVWNRYARLGINSSQAHLLFDWNTSLPLSWWLTHAATLSLLALDDGEDMELGGNGRSRSPSSTLTANPKL